MRKHLEHRRDNMNVIKNRKIYRIISLIILIIGLAMYFINGFNYGIDFTGGTVIEIELGKEVSVEEITPLVEKFDKDISVIHAGKDKEQLIIKSTLDLSNEDVLEITNIFEENYNISQDEVSASKIGPSMGSEIRNKALLSIGISTIAMLIYISIRFEFKFALASIIALIHDVLITIAIYAIFKLPVNSSFIAAILTIVGYSINDTIVIFDRIRENLKFNKSKDLKDIVNESINSSLRRTINTSVTTITAVAILYIVGVDAIRVLALPLILGMLAGTYSSIFIAPSIWYDLSNKK